MAKVFVLTMALSFASGIHVQAQGPAASAAPVRVLVVDDHPVNRLFVRTLLDEIGLETVEVEDGQQACDAVAAEHFDAILMDIAMPVMDGLAATRTIRAIEAERGDTPALIVMVSGNSRPEHVAASHDAGADQHLAKPVTPAGLEAALRPATDKQHAA